MKLLPFRYISSRPKYRYPDKQCIGRLCRVVNGRLVTITYLFL